MPDLFDFTGYERFPIKTNEHSEILIHLFENVHNSFQKAFELDDVSGYDAYDMHKESAEQLIKHLDGHCSDEFLISLIVESARTMYRDGLLINLTGDSAESRLKESLDLALQNITNK